jgi:hypothetical protein
MPTLSEEVVAEALDVAWNEWINNLTSPARLTAEGAGR